MKTRARWLILLAFGVFPSCDSNSESTSQMSVAPVSTAPLLQEVPNVEYECWKQFPLGTKVVRRKTMSNSHGTTTVTTKLELKLLDEKNAQVESQVTVVRPTETTQNPSEMLVFAATHKIPKEMNAKQFSLPSPDARLLREEEVEVENKKYTASVYQWKATLESGPVDVTGWFSDNFPARQIRLEFDYKDDTTGIDEIVLVEFPDTQPEANTAEEQHQRTN